jgi:hypothetical protein
MLGAPVGDRVVLRIELRLGVGLRMAHDLLTSRPMTRSLLAFSSALALLAMPGCTEVLVPDGPDFGLVSVFQSPLVQGAVFTNQASASALFGKGVPRSAFQLIDQDGACRIDHYPLPVLVSGPEAQVLDAGELRVTGGLTDLVMDFDGGYDFYAKSAIFEAGDVLTLQVEGSDEVAPISVTVPAPPTPVITPPPATIDIGEDLTFTWTSAPGTGTLQLDLQTSWDAVKTGSGEVHYPRDIVRCNVDISQGTVTMPASLLSQLTTSGSHPASVFAVASNGEILHRSGKSRVSFFVNADAATPSGEAYQFDADLK